MRTVQSVSNVRICVDVIKDIVLLGIWTRHRVQDMYRLRFFNPKGISKKAQWSWGKEEEFKNDGGGSKRVKNDGEDQCAVTGDREDRLDGHYSPYTFIHQAIQQLRWGYWSLFLGQSHLTSSQMRPWPQTCSQCHCQIAWLDCSDWIGLIQPWTLWWPSWSLQLVRVELSLLPKYSASQQAWRLSIQRDHLWHL